MASPTFIKNNIQFRIIASIALESYKHNQAFLLNELCFGTYEFGGTAKEALLLLYDVWFRWTLKVERYCLASGKALTARDISRLETEAQEAQETVFSIMVSHPKDFDEKFLEVWRGTHKHIDAYILGVIRSQQEKPATEAFPAIVSQLNNYLTSTLYELHEIDSIVQGKQPFLSFDELAVRYYEKAGLSIPLERYKVYEELLGIGPDIELKVYVGDKDSKDSQELCDRLCVKPLEEAGVTLLDIKY